MHRMNCEKNMAPKPTDRSVTGLTTLTQWHTKGKSAHGKADSVTLKKAL